MAGVRIGLVGFLVLGLTTPALAAEQPGDDAPLTRPVWRDKALDNHGLEYYPPAAKAEGIEGEAAARCVLDARLIPTDCRITHEDPEGWGFGHAVVRLASHLQATPASKPGDAFNLPMDFKIPGGPTAQTLRMLSAPAWTKTPTLDDLLLAWPSDPKVKAASDQVMLMCGLGADGTLQTCQTVSNDLEAPAFEQAARNLSRKFRIDMSGVDLSALRTLRVTLPIRFVNPNAGAGPRTLGKITWLVTPEPEQMKAAFPAAARAKGLRVGRAYVSCTIGKNGELAQCTPGEETPPGLGFGQAALTLAKVMRMSPWLGDGTPAEGETVNVPIRLDLGPPDPGAAD